MPLTFKPTIPFTAEAYQKLEQDFARLTEERKQVMLRLQTAREMGDLSENGAYKYAKFELGSIGRQLRQVKHLLKNGFIAQKQASTDSVDFGCTVTLKMGAKQFKYLIVSVHESNPTQGKISTDSPLGQALMGKKVGDEITVEAPAGKIQYKIIEIE